MFAFESTIDLPSSASPPTARKLAFGDIAPSQTAIDVLATASDAPTLVRDLSHAHTIADRAIEDEEWNTLLESAAVNLPVKYMLDHQWLHELCDKPVFQIIWMFFFLALAGAIGIGT
jgi:hypothetical protein